ncbi:MAG: hypothetical protein WBX95_19130 [Xanthobacteraceae bacterium]
MRPRIALSLLFGAFSFSVAHAHAFLDHASPLVGRRLLLEAPIVIEPEQ